MEKCSLEGRAQDMKDRRERQPDSGSSDALRTWDVRGQMQQSEARQLLKMPGTAMSCVTVAGKQVFNLDSSQFQGSIQYVWSATGLLLNTILETCQKKMSYPHAHFMHIVSPSQNNTQRLFAIS